MAKTDKEIVRDLESDVHGMPLCDLTIRISSAISLKRIADVLAGTPDSLGIVQHFMREFDHQ